MVKVLDDFLFLAPTELKCVRALDCFRDLANSINLPLAEHKTVAPVNCLEFLGVELDCESSEIRLPAEKLNEYLALVRDIIGAQKIPMRKMKSLAGKLNFAATVIPAGRTFIRRLYDSTIGHRNPNSSINVSDSVKKDLLMWEKFLSDFSGKLMMRAIPDINPATYSIVTDSSKEGYGGVFHKTSTSKELSLSPGKTSTYNS